jgi:hypothetical protein
MSPNQILKKVVAIQKERKANWHGQNAPAYPDLEAKHTRMQEELLKMLKETNPTIIPKVGKQVFYLKFGNVKRGRGLISEISEKPKAVKILPLHAGWKPIWVTPGEIDSENGNDPAEARRK